MPITMSKQNHVRLLALVILCAVPVSASQKYAATGILIQVDQPHHTITVSCKEIPGYMEAMTMSFPVRDPETLDHLEPGTAIDFSLVVDKTPPTPTTSGRIPSKVSSSIQPRPAVTS